MRLRSFALVLILLASVQASWAAVDIFDAIQVDDLTSVKRMADVDPKSLTVCKAMGRGAPLTPLHLAAYLGRQQIVTFLLLRGVDPNIRGGAKQTPLHEASIPLDTLDVVESMGILLDNGAQVNARDKNGLTPLDYAEKYERKTAASLLKQRGGKRSAQLR